MSMKEELRISLVQADIVWEDTSANLAHFEQLLTTLPATDVVLLPEMFSTAFSSNAQQLAEPTNGATMQAVRRWAAMYDCAFFGSFIAEENGHYYNRGFFVEPNGKTTFYDKRHLFLGGEAACFTAGKEQTVVSYLGWNLALAICYDLRFPVWLRNNQLRYDALLVVAEWPSNRQHIFENLLMARAIENQAYVCACNRVGHDNNFLQYTGGSQVIDYKGRIIERLPDLQESIKTIVLTKEPMQKMRQKLPMWQDSDSFSITD